MKLAWDKLQTGLDQLYFTPLTKGESAQDRADAIETFLSANGWTVDEVLKGMADESRSNSLGTSN